MALWLTSMALWLRSPTALPVYFYGSMVPGPPMRPIISQPITSLWGVNVPLAVLSLPPHPRSDFVFYFVFLFLLLVFIGLRRGLYYGGEVCNVL